MNLKKYRKLEEEFIEGVPGYPEGRFGGRGIVTMCGSLECYYVGAYVLIRLLRMLGCDLPVEVYKFDYERDERWDGMFNGMDNVVVKYHKVVCRNIDRKGWSLKPFAILDSSFEEVLFLDSDVAPAKNPDYLFDHPPYVEKGAIFWADVCGTHIHTRPTKENPSRDAFWHLAGRPEIEEKEFESGQVLIDKKKCWREINLTTFYNHHADWYYRFFLGDKETFHLAWRRLGKDFVFFDDSKSVDVPGGKFFYQYDMNNDLLFQHRSGNKFNLNGNILKPEFEHQDKILGYIEELKREIRTLSADDRRQPDN